MRQPCMCGAQDCTRCFPGAMDLVSCSVCDDSVPAFYYEDAGWCEINRENFCPDCYAGLKEKLKTAVTAVLVKHGIGNDMKVGDMGCGNVEHTDMCVGLTQLRELHIEKLLDVMEGIRLEADDFGLAVSVRLGDSPAGDARNARNALFIQHLGGGVGQYGCGCDLQTREACRMRDARLWRERNERRTGRVYCVRAFCKEGVRVRSVRG